MSVIALALVSAIAAGAAAPTPADAPLPSVTLPPELARVLTDYEKAWGAKDAAALAALFAEDGFVLQRNKPPVRGRDAIAGSSASVRQAARSRRTLRRSTRPAGSPSRHAVDFTSTRTTVVPSSATRSTSTPPRRQRRARIR